MSVTQSSHSFTLTPPSGDTAAALNHKALGAFYTPIGVAKLLVNWAIKSPTDTVLDPSCGKGVFLSEAVERLRGFGSTEPVVWGIDFDPLAADLASSSVPHSKILREDFFAVTPEQLQPFAAVVGNPPFIRYQTFSGKAREAALRRAKQAGVTLDRLTSSWAPFVVHAVGFVRPGGRFAMVVPAELGHARYAREVLRFLTREFGEIRVCMFRRKLFPELSEDTFILLAANRGVSCSQLSVAAFESIEQADPDAEPAGTVDLDSVRSGGIRLSHYLLPERTRALYHALSQAKDVIRLGDVADVGIGYVTGCNDFFHLSMNERLHYRIPEKYLRPAITSLGNHRGLIVTRADWNERQRFGEKIFLLALPHVPQEDLPLAVRKLLARGMSADVHTRFKCRVREPWYSVPHIRAGDAFLSYMAGGFPKLVLNQRKFVAPNTLHIVRFDGGCNARSFAAGWHSSLTRLSCEIEGHALGGGMLKLEPTEAERVLVVSADPHETTSLLGKADRLLRNGEVEAAREVVDSHVLGRKLGLGATEGARLQDAAIWAESWRLHR